MLQKYTKMSKEELLDHLDTLNREYGVYIEKEKKLKKARDKGLNWFWLIPIFGLVLRSFFASKRAKVPEFYSAITHCKEEMLKIELQVMFINKLIKEDKFDEIDNNTTNTKDKKNKSTNVDDANHNEEKIVDKIIEKNTEKEKKQKNKKSK